MLKQRILGDLKLAVKNLGFSTGDIVVSIPKNPAFGDYTTNIALQLAKQKSVVSYQSSDEIAKAILEKLGKPDYLERAEVAGSGFINFFIKDEVLLQNLTKTAEIPQTKNPQKIMVEYGHANILKEAHTGHLRTYILGESFARLLSALGNEVFRANYQSDLSLNIAQTLWGIEKSGWPEGNLTLVQEAKFLGQAYTLGKSIYTEDPSAKKEIDEMTAALYQGNFQPREVYGKARQWSLEYFEDLYKLLGIKYDRLFFESEVHEPGKEIVLKHIGPVFEKSEGAVIFPGEKYGLHNRVFINSAGNSTYEGKDIGLAKLQAETYPFDLNIHVVGNEQASYFEVIFKAVEQVFPELKGKECHLSYGMISFKGGKMSSRTGEVISINDLYEAVAAKVREVMKEGKLKDDEEVIRKVALGAIKYSYLKFAPVSNFIFDLDQSVSLQGDSGPYLQYTYARSQSVLRQVSYQASKQVIGGKLETEERALIRRLEYFSGSVEQSAKEYRPNLLAEYLMDLAKEFNLFYQKHRIIQSEERERRLALTWAVGNVLKQGLYLLGIEAPERM
ncbi:arginine--tRNA ligase [Candidatus Daviesbacteria bacterium]|nr:arginine--tRNA ligase [Candidatus Daviesbacteria bacterium]